MDRFAHVINDVYKKYDIPRIFPVPLSDIAEALGYGIFYFKVTPDNEHISGATLYKEKKILLNPDDSGRRRFFTLAHEIAHILLKHDNEGTETYDTRSDMKDPAKGSKEYEANEFAAELLMPENDFRKAWSENRGLANLSEFFGTSMDAVATRLIKLGIDYVKY